MEKDNLKNVNKKLGKGASEFKEFIMQGNVVDLAVGVIIGGAFGKIVTSLVNDILMPIIGILIGGIDFTGLSVEVADAKILYGSFIQNIVDFLIIAFCIFCVVKTINTINDKFRKKEEEKKETKKKDEQVALLEDIRDLLRRQKSTR